MKIKPVVLKLSEVRAILDGEMTQLRRPLNIPDGWEAEPRNSGGYLLGQIISAHLKINRFGLFIIKTTSDGLRLTDIVTSPFGGPGDRLWVRETHHIPGGYLDKSEIDEIRNGIISIEDLGVIYRARCAQLATVRWWLGATCPHAPLGESNNPGDNRRKYFPGRRGYGVGL